VQQLGLDERTKPVNTTGNRNKEVDEEELESEQATQYRAMTARCNYLSQDRSDIQYAVKELCRSMSKPTVEDWAKLKHLAKYLKDKTRYRTVYRYQGPVNKVTVYTDTDYAGCHKTRKSTSGGVLQIGKHVIKTWSTTQSVISLSSGEAEYYGLVKGAAQAIGLQSILKDIGIQVNVTVRTDASAAKGIAMRRGMGKVRHIEVQQLWVQDKVATGQIVVEKISTTANPADNLTKYLSNEDIAKHMWHVNGKIVDSRHELTPQVAQCV
jgi:hypothetical protein